MPDIVNVLPLMQPLPPIFRSMRLPLDAPSPAASGQQQTAR